jgi:hypothetical protein
MSSLEKTDLSEYHRLVDVNQTGVLLGMKHAVEPHCDGAGDRIDREPLLGGGARRRGVPDHLHRDEVRGPGDEQGGGAGARTGRDPGQLGPPGGDPDADDRGDGRRPTSPRRTFVESKTALERMGAARGGRRRRRVPAQRRRLLRDGGGDRHRRGATAHSGFKPWEHPGVASGPACSVSTPASQPPPERGREEREIHGVPARRPVRERRRPHPRPARAGRRSATADLRRARGACQPAGPPPASALGSRAATMWAVTCPTGPSTSRR